MAENNEMLIKIYGAVEVIKDQTARIERKQDEHSREIEKLNKHNDDHSRRIKSLEQTRLETMPLIEKAEDAIKVTEHISTYRYRYILSVVGFVLFISSIFTLWVVDPRVIDVKPLREVSRTLLDPTGDVMFGNGVSHDVESK